MAARRRRWLSGAELGLVLALTVAMLAGVALLELHLSVAEFFRTRAAAWDFERRSFGVVFFPLMMTLLVPLLLPLVTVVGLKRWLARGPVVPEVEGQRARASRQRALLTVLLVGWPFAAVACVFPLALPTRFLGPVAVWWLAMTPLLGPPLLLDLVLPTRAVEGPVEELMLRGEVVSFFVGPQRVRVLSSDARRPKPGQVVRVVVSGFFGSLLALEREDASG